MKAESQPDSAGFYARLKGLRDFSDFSRSTSYRALPEDWSIVITDVQASTRAIDKGKYKQVNAVGVASIVALKNALDPFVLPYVFGGDGVAGCFPEGMLDRVRPALLASRRMASEQFGLELRIGIVPIGDVRKSGHDVLLAKYQPHAAYQQAMFAGDGMSVAEKWVKLGSLDSDYLIKGDDGADCQIFTGFECRWDEVPSPHGENIALLVRVVLRDRKGSERIYHDVLEKLRGIYGSEADYHPLRGGDLSLTGSFARLSVEAGVCTAFTSSVQRLAYQCNLQIRRWLGNWFMRRGMRIRGTDWGLYRQRLVANTDFRKFDDMLRMVISGSKGQRRQLQAFLEDYRDKGMLVYGMHVSASALITCMVGDYDQDHVHFVDGAGGGYAMAAQQMKKQINDTKPKEDDNGQ